MEDKELLTQIKHNDKKAFETIFRAYFHFLQEYPNFYIGNSPQTEDIVQDIFLKLGDSRDRLSIHSSLKGYLLRSIHNNCIQYLRHKVVEQNHHVIHQAKI